MIKDGSNTWKSLQKPTEEQTAQYNEQVKASMADHNTSDQHTTPKDRINDRIIALGNAMKTAAETHFEKRDIH